jgi:hypothetical protein
MLVGRWGWPWLDGHALPRDNRGRGPEIAVSGAVQYCGSTCGEAPVRREFEPSFAARRSGGKAPLEARLSLFCYADDAVDAESDRIITGG